MTGNFSQIAYEEHDEIRVIRFDRPEVMNCIGPTTHAELVEAWDRFRTDEGAKVAIITGAGDRAFCAGGDLKDGPVSADPAEIAAHGRGERPGILGPSRWTDIYKPIIAAVNGVAYAGGLEWACFADIRIAEEHASFGVTCRRWNFGLADGGTQRLPRIVGMGRAMELIITGRVIDAREAERIGLVNRVVPSGESLGAALELARAICALPQPRDPHRQGGGAARLRPAPGRGSANRGRVLLPLDLPAGDVRGPAPVPRTRPPGPAQRPGSPHARHRQALARAQRGASGYESGRHQPQGDANNTPARKTTYINHFFFECTKSPYSVIKLISCSSSGPCSNESRFSSSCFALWGADKQTCTFGFDSTNR